MKYGMVCIVICVDNSLYFLSIMMLNGRVIKLQVWLLVFVVCLKISDSSKKRVLIVFYDFSSY